MASVDGTSIIVAFPAMVAEFQSSLAWLGWVFTAYNLLVGVSMPITSGIAGLIGLRTAFLVAISLFLIGAIGSMLAPSVEALIACRAVAALGGGAFMPLSSSLLAGEFPQQRGRMLGLLATLYPVGSIVGPNVGGWIVSNWGWRGIFLIDIPVCIAGLTVAAFTLKREVAVERKNLDVIGVVLLVLGMLPVMIGLTLASSQFDATVIALVVLGAVMLVALVWWEGRHPNPVIDLNLVRRRPFVITNVMAFGLAMFVFSGFNVFPLYLDAAYGLSAGQIGPVLTPRSVASVTLATICSFYLPRLGFRLPLALGFSLIGLSYMLFALQPSAIAFAGIELSEPIVVALTISISGLGMGFVLPSLNTLGIDSHPEKAAAIAGMRGAFNTFGLILGTTLALLVVSRVPDQLVGLQAVIFVGGIGIASFVLLTPLLPKKTAADVPAPNSAPEPDLVPR